MALLFMDGFDHYTTDGNSFSTTLSAGAYNSSLSGNVSIETMPILGGLGLGVGSAGSTSELRWELPSAKSSGKLGVGFHFVYATATTTARNPSIVALYPSSGSAGDFYDLYLNYDTDIVQLRHGTSVLDSFSISQDTLYHFELVWTHGSGTGSVELRVNGVPTLSASGLTTPSITGVSLVRQPSGTVNAVRTRYYDNFFVWDESGSENNDWLGERNVVTLLPSSDETPQDWALSSGSDAYDLLNDVPPTSAYVESDTPTDVSVFGMTDLPHQSYNIAGIMTVVSAVKTDAGVSEISFGPVGDLSPAVALIQDQYTRFYHVSEVNPATSLPWAAAEVDAVEIQIEKVT